LTHFIGVQTDVTEIRRASEERHELEIARNIQQSLLPKAAFKGEHVSVAGICISAYDVGGDYYDYFPAEDSLGIVIADVSGHSVGAALIMAEARSALKAEARRHAAGPRGAAATVNALNELLFEDLSGSDFFISMFYLHFDVSSRLLRYANAGHVCALWLPVSEDTCRQLDAEGLLLGVRESVEFEERSLQLQEGDRILLYTDGVTEAQDQQGEFYGVERLNDCFVALRDEEPEAVVQSLILALQEFRHGASFLDDVSLVVVKVE
jgi:sigma-B regulation protein RsbU (phosphoserine phosphatase)